MTDPNSRPQSPIRRIALITNPVAGLGSSMDAARRATEFLANRGIDVVSIASYLPLTTSLRTREFVADPTIDAIVVCGGDGLINLALQEVVGTGKLFGVIPAGTGNDLAREYSIPFDPRAAASLIVDGHHDSVDVGLMSHANGEERYFATIMCAGVDSMINDRANQIRWPKGNSRYLLALGIEFARLRPLRTTIRIDGKGTHHVPTILNAIAITKTYGGGIMMCPHADPRDGLLSISLVETLNRLEAISKVPKTFLHRLEEVPEVHMYRAHSVDIEVSGLDAFADGERLMPMPLRIECVPRALNLIMAR